MWRYEVYDRKSHKLLISNTGFHSEAEAEYNSRLDADHAGIVNYYVKVIEDTK